MSKSSTKIIRKEVKQLAESISSLAQEISKSLADGGDPMLSANELARKSNTFIFALGEMYALQKAHRGGKDNTRYSVRNNRGQFSKQ